MAADPQYIIVFQSLLTWGQDGVRTLQSPTPVSSGESLSTLLPLSLHLTPAGAPRLPTAPSTPAVTGPAPAACPPPPSRPCRAPCPPSSPPAPPRPSSRTRRCRTGSGGSSPPCPSPPTPWGSRSARAPSARSSWPGGRPGAGRSLKRPKPLLGSLLGLFFICKVSLFCKKLHWVSLF